MSHQSELIATDIDAYLRQHEQKELLRFITCGSVDDGKSTLIGRLLYDSKMIYEDQLATLRQDSKVHGTTGGDFDPALLTDGLKAEREQGITIDVAYRYFSTAKRKFIIADTPGHEQYTRNMATGASTADLAIILVDARHGVVTQTRRHAFINSLLGIKHVLVATNKMDLVDYSESVFEQIRDDYQNFAARIDIPDLHFIPMSALLGQNVVEPVEHMPWYRGHTFMNFLEAVYIGSDRNLEDFRFPVQLVNRPNLDFRGYCGTIGSGMIRKGEDILVLPSRKTSKVKDIITQDGSLDEAFAPQAVTLALEDEIDISRGDIIVRPGNLPRVNDRFDAMVVWMDETPMVPGKTYIFKQSANSVTGNISTLRYVVDVNTLHRSDTPVLKLNEIGRCTIRLTEGSPYDGYRRNRTTGSFIVIDRITNITVGAGMIQDRASDADRHDHWDDTPQSESLHRQLSNVTHDERSARFGQQPTTVLLTGLTGSGKTTLSYALERRLFDQGRACTVLDGHNLRLGISRGLVFSAEDRSENLRRTVEVVKLLNNAGMICIVGLIAPDASIRKRAAAALGDDGCLVVHLSAPVEVCRERDTDCQYALVDAGEISNFPDVSALYEEPESPDLVLPTHEISVDECVEQLFELLQSRSII